MRVCVPQGACAGFDVPGYGRVHAKNGIVTVPDRIGRDLIRFDECFPVADRPKAIGFLCDACGFATYFRECGRCGGTCHRPGEDHAPQDQQ